MQELIISPPKDECVRVFRPNGIEYEKIINPGQIFYNMERHFVLKQMKKRKPIAVDTIFTGGKYGNPRIDY